MNVAELRKRLVLVQNAINKIKNSNRLFEYNTGDKVHEKQLAFHKCNKKNRWVFGGNRSGKTECGAVETIWLARGIHPYRENKPDIECWVVSLSTQVQRDVAQHKILNYLNKDWIEDIVMLSGKKSSMDMGVIDFITIRNVFGGVSKIGFKSCDQGREKFQGTSLDFVWFDEEPPLDIYLECKMRVLDKCGDIFATMTPLKGLSWVYNTIYLNENNDPEVWYENISWYDNPFLNKREIESFRMSLSKDELESRCYGNFVGNGGLVYSEFEESVNVIDPFEIPADWQDNISIDPGLNNPLSAHWYAVDFANNIYVVAEHFEAGKSVEYHATKIKEISQRLNWKKSNNGQIEALIDSAANQKTLSGRKSVTELFYDYGILVNPRVNKDLFSGINRVKSYIKNANGESRLFIFRNCTNLIKEIKGYFWGSGDAPVKKDDHCLDELRYYIMSRPDNSNNEFKKTNVEMDREKIYRKLIRSRNNGVKR